MNIWQVKKLCERYTIKIKNKLISCQVGKNGIIDKNLKREGDLFTPIGKWKLRSLYYREDKCSLINESLNKKIKINKISKACGWCDDINSKFYNQRITIPQNNKNQLSYEKLWRDDNAYDIFFELGYNDNPVVKGMGSAIFLHCSFDDVKYTAGCVAMEKSFFKYALENLTSNTYIEIKTK